SGSIAKECLNHEGHEALSSGASCLFLHLASSLLEKDEGFVTFVSFVVQLFWFPPPLRRSSRLSAIPRSGRLF
ncbi:MAG TPA: hypothetical protein VHT04_10095, partial [Stellaceae bacterium]|nr:hypothetical protein [Stellaceae bacterium]